MLKFVCKSKSILKVFLVCFCFFFLCSVNKQWYNRAKSNFLTWLLPPVSNLELFIPAITAAGGIGSHILWRGITPSSPAAPLPAALSVCGWLKPAVLSGGRQQGLLLALSVLGVLSGVLPSLLPSPRKTARSFLLGRSRRLLNRSSLNFIGVFNFLLLQGQTSCFSYYLS